MALLASRPLARCGTPARRSVRVSAAPEATPSRRAALLTVPSLLAVLAATPSALADDEDALVTFYGAANPPATYGGVGGTTKDKARYSFSVPSSWVEDTVSKTEKGASGVDSRFLGPRRTRAKAFVITLRSEGSREGIGFVAKDGDSALKAVTGGAFELQDILAAGTLAVSGTGPYRYVLSGGPTALLADLSTSPDGRLFAFFITVPAAEYAAHKELYEAMLASWRTYELKA